MKTKILLSILCIGAMMTMFSFGQDEKLNSLDENGKKDGKWIEYLDMNWKVMNDSGRARYCAYNYYHHGQNKYYISFGNDYKLHHTLKACGTNAGWDGNIKMLDGEYTWFDNKGRIVTVDKFVNGEHIWSNYYAWKRWDTYPMTFLGAMFGYNQKLAGTLHEFYDFTKKYNDQPGSYYMESYNKKGSKSVAWERQGDFGWAAYEE